MKNLVTWWYEGKRTKENTCHQYREKEGGGIRIEKISGGNKMLYAYIFWLASRFQDFQQFKLLSHILELTRNHFKICVVSMSCTVYRNTRCKPILRPLIRPVMPIMKGLAYRTAKFAENTTNNTSYFGFIRGPWSN